MALNTPQKALGLSDGPTFDERKSKPAGVSRNIWAVFEECICIRTAWSYFHVCFCQRYVRYYSLYMIGSKATKIGLKKTIMRFALGYKFAYVNFTG